MKITVIRYRRLQSHEQGYGHDAIEAEAQIEEGETASHALAELKRWVLSRLIDQQTVERLVRQEDVAQRRVNSLTKERDKLKEEIATATAVVGKFESLAQLAAREGFDVSAAALTEAVSDGIPF